MPIVVTFCRSHPPSVTTISAPADLSEPMSPMMERHVCDNLAYVVLDGDQLRGTELPGRPVVLATRGPAGKWTVCGLEGETWDTVSISLPTDQIANEIILEALNNR